MSSDTRLARRQPKVLTAKFKCKHAKSRKNKQAKAFLMKAQQTPMFGSQFKFVFTIITAISWLGNSLHSAKPKILIGRGQL